MQSSSQIKLVLLHLFNYEGPEIAKQGCNAFAPNTKRRTQEAICCRTALARRSLETTHKPVNRWMKPFTIHTVELPAAAKAARPIPTYSHRAVSEMDGYRKKARWRKEWIRKEGPLMYICIFLHYKRIN